MSLTRVSHARVVDVVEVHVTGPDGPHPVFGAMRGTMGRFTPLSDVRSAGLGEVRPAR